MLKRTAACSLLFLSISGFSLAQQGAQVCASPGKQIEIAIRTAQQPGAPSSLVYSVRYRGNPVINDSRLGLDPLGQSPLGADVEITGATPSSGIEEYKLAHGKTSAVRHPYSALVVNARERGGAGRMLEVEIRAFDDGVAFRYRVPQQPALRVLELERELTEFRLSRDGTVYPLFLNGFRTSYEDNYVALPVSAIKPDALIALPLLAELPGVAWVAITEAGLEDYAGMYLVRGESGTALTAKLSPRTDRPEIAVIRQIPASTPWRVIQIAAEPAKLIESNIVLSLNEPSRIADASWIRPGKTSWTWWSGEIARGVQEKPGMTTAMIKHYIDFSAAAGLEYVLIDEGWSTNNARGQGDLRQVRPAIDLPGVIDYARQKNVRVWLWAHWEAVDRLMDEVFPLFAKWGVAGVKIDFMDRDDQWMVGFYHRAAERAAANKLLLDFHGAYKPTGMSRTWPNVLTYEGVLGLEYLKWSGRTTADHNTFLPFTRMLAGPLDYTPGGFRNVAPAEFRPRNIEPLVPNTRAHQLGLYVVFESALQMLADHPGAYEGQKELAFLKAVPAVWDETRGVAGRPGEYAVVARRSGQTWFIGGITNHDGRALDVPLDFLPAGDFTAEVYSDAGDPATTEIKSQKATRTGKLSVRLAPTGGFAATLRPAR